MNEPLNIPVDHELSDLIVRQWLQQHLLYAEQSYKESKMIEDRAEAAVDLLAMRRVLQYAGGESQETDPVLARQAERDAHVKAQVDRVVKDIFHETEGRN